MYRLNSEDVFSDYHKTINEISNIYHQVTHKYPRITLSELTTNMSQQVDNLLNLFEIKKAIKKQNTLEDRLK